MNEREKPKLNLRGESSPPIPDASDTDVESLLSRLDEAKAAKQQPPAKRRVTKRQDLNTEFSTQGDSLRNRVKKPEADIGEVWEDLLERQKKGEQNFLATHEVGEVIDKVGSALGGVSKRFRSAYSGAAAESRSRVARAYAYP